MSFGEFLVGVVQVVLVAGLAGFVAWRLRARFLPGWSGPPARLVEAVAGTGLLVVSSELLGLFGLLRAVPLIILLAVVAAGVWLRLLPRTPRPVDSVPPSFSLGTGAQLVAFTVIFAVVAQWGAFTSYNLDHGITNFDSVWYHLPFAAEMAQTGSVTNFFHTETVFVNWFYPQNSELIHAIGMVLTGRDFLSVFMNLGWLALGLLAGWCVGRPYARPHLTMLGVAVLMGTHTLVVREPGTAKNDIMAAALVLSAVAIMLNRSSSGREPKGRVSPDWAMAAGGLAIGLAAGTKVTALAPAVLVTCAVVYAAMPGTRLRSFGVWAGSALIGGGWWYFRNLIATGNPVPQVTSIGPIELPGPGRIQVGRPDFSVAHYLFDGEIWREYFVPGLNQGFGHVWPVILVAVVAGLILIMLTGPGRLTRVHGAVALLAIGAYLVTPLGAAGPEGDPTGFAINLRFLVPALGLGIVIVPLSRWFDGGWPPVALGVLLVGLFIGTSASDPVISAPGRRFGFALALLLVALPLVAWLARERLSRRVGIPALAAALGLAALVFVLFAWPLQKSYFDNRYKHFEQGTGLESAYRWANGISDARIALAGSTAGFKQFGFRGPDLTNEIVYIGREAPKGGFDAIGTCEEFAEAVNETAPDYLVTSPFLNFNGDEPIASPEADWISGDPAVSREVEPAGTGDGVGPVTVWRVEGQLDPSLCERLDPSRDYIPGLADDA